jgi:hypothetical protein
VLVDTVVLAKAAGHEGSYSTTLLVPVVADATTAGGTNSLLLTGGVEATVPFIVGSAGVLNQFAKNDFSDMDLKFRIIQMDVFLFLYASQKKNEKVIFFFVVTFYVFCFWIFLIFNIFI